jgi:glycosyltransferase involved in cell wall biosynthesis
LKLNINLFFRKKTPEFNSFEEIFLSLTDSLCDRVKFDQKMLPYSRVNLRNIISNLIYSWNNKGKINHITGQVYYASIIIGKNTIITLHDIKSFFQSQSKFKNFLIKYFFLKLPIYFSKRITVISNFTKKELIDSFPEAKSKTRVIYNPVNKNLTFTPKKFNSFRPTILLIGTKENKNVIRTVRALVNISCKLVIIGKLSIEQKNLLDYTNIEYINKFNIPYVDVINCYMNCDIVSFVSTYEGFGMPIIESQAIGRAVITSNVCSMPEIAGHGACIVNPFNEDEIGKGVLKIIENKKYRNKLITKGLENISRFQIQNISNQYYDLYQEMV